MFNLEILGIWPNYNWGYHGSKKLDFHGTMGIQQQQNMWLTMIWLSYRNGELGYNMVYDSNTHTSNKYFWEKQWIRDVL